MNKYSSEEISEEEYNILHTLKFKVATPTLNSWANRLAVQWDMYLDTVELRYYDVIFENLHLIKFKTCGDNTVIFFVIFSLTIIIDGYVNI